jgi:hypothetical protein
MQEEQNATTWDARSKTKNGNEKKKKEVSGFKKKTSLFKN